MQNFKKLLFLLSKDERKRVALLLVMITIMATLDMIGVASILPFMTILTNPNLIETNYLINSVFQVSTKFGVKNNQDFLIMSGFIVFILLIISLTFKAITTYLQIRFVQLREYSIGKRLLEGYLHQPYSWFLSRNSADIGKTILSEVQQVISFGLNPFMEIVAKGMVTIALIILLIVADPKLTLVVGFSLALTYFLIFYFVKNYLKKNGEERLKNNKLRFTSITEAFGAVKEVKVGGLEENYINSFSKSAKIFAQSQSSSIILSQIPRFVLEAIAFGGILLIILYIMSQTGSFNNALPIISLYVLAGYRLMPALQQIYKSFTQLAFVIPSLEKMHSDLKNLQVTKSIHDKNIITLNNQLELNCISYTYPNSTRLALENVSLSISAKSIVGIIGKTGSGKTTIVDIILGLLEFQKGDLKVDGKIITNKNSRSWQKSIGYVPQNIFLSDDTIESNIALGVDPTKIDKSAVEKASKIANLHQFVINELPKKYKTSIGEKGIRISGGQRQRIGIARALYHNPELLILDEATSSLDNNTEEAVMDAIKNLSKKITIILIAHRLNTVKDCDIIYKLDKGRLIDQGKPDYLL